MFPLIFITCRGPEICLAGFFGTNSVHASGIHKFADFTFPNRRASCFFRSRHQAHQQKSSGSLAYYMLTYEKPSRDSPSRATQALSESYSCFCCDLKMLFSTKSSSRTRYSLNGSTKILKGFLEHIRLSKE